MKYRGDEHVTIRCELLEVSITYDGSKRGFLERIFSELLREADVFLPCSTSGMHEHSDSTKYFTLIMKYARDTYLAREIAIKLLAKHGWEPLEGEATTFDSFVDQLLGIGPETLQFRNAAALRAAPRRVRR